MLLAYAKIVLVDDLLDTDITDDKALDSELTRYFPARMAHDYGDEIAGAPAAARDHRHACSPMR